jgi:hypothetical protein
MHSNEIKIAAGRLIFRSLNDRPGLVGRGSQIGEGDIDIDS